MMEGLGGENCPQAVSAMDMSAKLVYRDDVTLRQNIDQKIKRFQDEIAELEKSKEMLAPLLDMRLDLMRKAMQR